MKKSVEWLTPKMLLVLYTIIVTLYTIVYTKVNNIVYMYTNMYTSFVYKGVRLCVQVYKYVHNITVVC